MVGIKSVSLLWFLQFIEICIATCLHQNSKEARPGVHLTRILLLVVLHPYMVTALGIYTLLNVSTPHYSI